MEPLYLNDADIQNLVSPQECAEVIEDLFQQEARGDAEQTPTVELHLPKRGPFRVKVGGVYGANAYGLKAYLGSAGYRVFVYDLDEGFLGLVEAFKLTEIRTGAVSAVATKHMSRPDAANLGIIGTGREARAQLRALAGVRPLRAVKAYSRSVENREAYCAEMSKELGISMTPVATAREALQGADILVTMTSANDPVLDGADLEPGTFVCCVGATGARRRELDDEAVRRSQAVVVEHLPLAELECGELIHAAGNGLFDWSRVSEIKDVVSGKVAVNTGDINLFTSIGTGAEDVAVAAFALRRARERGIGLDLPLPPPMMRRR